MCKLLSDIFCMFLHRTADSHEYAQIDICRWDHVTFVLCVWASWCKKAILTSAGPWSGSALLTQRKSELEKWIRADRPTIEKAALGFLSCANCIWMQGMTRVRVLDLHLPIGVAYMSKLSVPLSRVRWSYPLHSWRYFFHSVAHGALTLKICHFSR